MTTLTNVQKTSKPLPYKVLLYYEMQPIADPQAFVEEHIAFCEKHNLKGRIIVAKEGINGTCAGLTADVDTYMHYVHSLPGLDKVWFKEQLIDHQPFPKLHIRERPEVVTLGVDGLDNVPGAPHITPQQVNDMIENDDVVLFDMRSAIEGEVGRFKDAVVPDIRFFRELPEKLNQYANLKDKKVIMYCTGGIRCEKASKLFIKEGFKHVYQIEGGVYNYCTQFPNKHYEGSCYVFDDRMQITFDKDGDIIPGIPEQKVISSCAFCDTKTARIVNDERKQGRVLVVCCEQCDKQHDVSRLRVQKKQHLGDEIGVGQHYYPKPKVAQVKVRRDSLFNGDEVIVHGPTTGTVTVHVDDMKVHDEPVEEGFQVVTFVTDQRIRPSDVIYRA